MPKVGIEPIRGGDNHRILRPAHAILCASQLIRGDDFLSEYFSEAHVYVNAASDTHQSRESFPWSFGEPSFPLRKRNGREGHVIEDTRL